MRKIVGIGAGGHAKILVELLAQMGGFELVGVTDTDPSRWGTQFMDSMVLGGDDQLPIQRAKGVKVAFIGVGAISSDGVRLRARTEINPSVDSSAQCTSSNTRTSGFSIASSSRAAHSSPGSLSVAA